MDRYFCGFSRVSLTGIETLNRLASAFCHCNRLASGACTIPEQDGQSCVTIISNPRRISVGKAVLLSDKTGIGDNIGGKSGQEWKNHQRGAEQLIDRQFLSLR